MATSPFQPNLNKYHSVSVPQVNITQADVRTPAPTGLVPGLTQVGFNNVTSAIDPTRKNAINDWTAGSSVIFSWGALPVAQNRLNED